MQQPWLDLLSVCQETPPSLQWCVFCKLHLPDYLAAWFLAGFSPGGSMRINQRPGGREMPGCSPLSCSELGRVSNSCLLWVCCCWTAPPPWSQFHQVTQGSGADNIPFLNLECVETPCYYLSLGLASQLYRHLCNQLPLHLPYETPWLSTVLLTDR